MDPISIPLEFRQPPMWPGYMEPPTLPYKSQRYDPGPNTRPQRVLKDRHIFEPVIDLNNYDCTAVIDWIDVRFDTPRIHQARNIQPNVDKFLKSIGSTSTTYVCGPNHESRSTGQSFILRVQQPVCWELPEVLKFVACKYGLDMRSVKEFEIGGIELSVDFRVKATSSMSQDKKNLLRWQIADVLRRHLKPGPQLTEAPNCHPRFFYDEYGERTAKYVVLRKLRRPSSGLFGEAKRLDVDPDCLTPLSLSAHTITPIDTTSYIGAKEGPFLLRVMEKTTDRRNPKTEQVVDLPPEDWRARLEITALSMPDRFDGPSALGLDKIENLYGFRFKCVRKPFFEFFLPTLSNTSIARSLPFPIDVDEKAVFERSGVYGLDRLHRAVESIQSARYREKELTLRPIRLGSKGHLLSFEALNRKVDRALESLSRQWEDALTPDSRSFNALKSRSR